MFAKFFIILTLGLVSLSCFNNVIAKVIEVPSSNIFVFKDPNNNGEIKLKVSKIGTCSVDVLYIAEIKYKARDIFNVYLSLQDKDGFEIEKKFIGAIAKEFRGTLKGSFSTPFKEFKEISNVEIQFYG